jgi:hypothetical protein
MFKFIIKTFDQLKNDNLDQVNSGQTIPCHFFLNVVMPVKGNGLNQEVSNSNGFAGRMNFLGFSSHIRLVEEL